MMTTLTQYLQCVLESPVAFNLALYGIWVVSSVVFIKSVCIATRISL